MRTELRDYQARAIEDIRQSLRNGVNRLVCQAATGAGKTKIAAAIVDSALTKGKRTAFVVPAISLVDQTLESLADEGILDVGVIQANHLLTDWSKPVQVCSIQTIQRRGYPQADVVIIDECHRLHDAHKKWIKDPEWQKVPMIGLSATPWTKGLGKFFDSLLIAATAKDLIEQGYLSKFRVFATGHPDLTGVKISAGDYVEKDLSDAMQKGSLSADIISTWLKLWGKDKTLCFAVDKAHARALKERFESAGISTGYQDAETSEFDRKENKRKFHNGEYRIVVNIQTLTTGVDWDVRCLILARPTRSEMLFVQIIGRALRTAEGKEDALILDHSDSTSKLGFVTDIHHERLSNGQPQAASERKDPLPKECSKCSYLKPPKTSTCPNCGHKAEAPINMIYEDDGELVEIKPGALIKINNAQKVWTELEQKVFYRELLGYAEAHGFKKGWAWHKFKEKFGFFAPPTYKYLTPANSISPGMELWVRKCNIAWRKRKSTDMSMSHG